MSRKQRHYHIKYYEEKLSQLKKNKQDFELITTTYTKRIVTNDQVYFFNDEGKDDTKGLLLISTVRNDAKKYLETNTVQHIYNNNTDFFNVLDVIEHKEVIKKIDIRSAYWSYAIKMGVITEQTNNKFLEWYKNIDVEYAKQARLKALGSLATTKFTNVYLKGKWAYSKPTITEPTKDLYMEICNGIDRLMKDVNYKIEGCKYYYWDCIFVNEDSEPEVIEYLRDRGYDVSIGETRLEFVDLNGVGYLRSIEDGKMYMTKRENKHLLQFDDEYEYEFE